MTIVALIGYRGSGKTTVARLLAARLGWDSCDADAEIEQRAGTSIRQIFAHDGEPRFRDWEEQIVADLVTRRQVVLSLGGGAVLREANRQALAGTTVVWLIADAETIYSRLAADSTTSERRPDLTAAGGREEITELLRQREAVYRACADYSVDTTGKTPEQVAEEIVCLLQTDR